MEATFCMPIVTTVQYSKVVTIYSIVQYSLLQYSITWLAHIRSIKWKPLFVRWVQYSVVQYSKVQFSGYYYCISTIITKNLLSRRLCLSRSISVFLAIHVLFLMPVFCISVTLTWDLLSYLYYSNSDVNLCQS